MKEKKKEEKQKPEKQKKFTGDAQTWADRECERDRIYSKFSGCFNSRHDVR